MLRYALFALVSVCLALAQQPPVNPAIQVVVNGASFDNRLAPGVLATVIGSNLAGTTAQGQGSPLPTELGGVSVQIGGKPGALTFISASQVTFQVPVDLPTGPATVQVERKVGAQTLRSAQVNVTLDKYAPGLFTVAGGGKGLGLFMLSGGQIVGGCTTAKPGDTVFAFAVGLGPTNPVVPTGAAPSGAAPTVAQPKVTVGGKEAQVVYSGLAPGMAGGTYQVNLKLAADTPSGDQPVVLEIDGQKSQDGVILPVGTPTKLAVTLAATANRADAVISSGSWMSIYGCVLAPTTRIWRDPEEIINDKLPTSLDGVSVKVNGKSAAVWYISPTQINAQVPTDTTEGSVKVEVAGPAGQGTVNATLRRYSPSFSLFDPEGGKYLAAAHLDWVYVGKARLFGEAAATRPAKPGDIVQLFGTGF
ncbi:MAG: hypothetical protein FJW34_23040, partial [Acidobacteria bacterium]|nr:hypothetical protein [Acidobacteriota bacterium]